MSARDARDPELERLRQAFAAGSETAAQDSACPEPETLWAAVRGELPPAELRRVLDHVAGCPACAEDWRLAAELAGGEAAATRAAELPARRRAGALQTVRGAAWALAAAAAVVLAVGLYLRGPGVRPPVEVRGAGEPAVRALVPPTPLPRAAARLRWTLEPPVAGARYDVRVTTEELAPVAEASGLAAAEFVVPPEALASLPAGSRLFWRVEARLPDGGRVASTTFTVPLE